MTDSLPRTIVRIIARLNIGGPAQQAVWLSARVGSPAWRTVLVTGQLAAGEGDMSDLAARHGVVPVVVPALGRTIRPWDDLTALASIVRLLWREHPDVVHTHTAKAGTLGRIAAWWYNGWHPRHRCRIVHTFHGHVFDGYFGRWATWWFVQIERWLAARTDRILAVSDRVRREILARKIGRPEQVVIVPLGLELEPFLQPRATSHELGARSDQRPTTNNQQSTAKGKPAIVGIVGRLVPVKNHRLLLDAAHLVARSSQIAARFWIIGDGELRDDLQRYATLLGLNGAVRFLGWRRDLPVVYRDLDIVVLTSRNEGSPVSLIEAMAAARPIVATDVGGVRELLTGDEGRGTKEEGSRRKEERGVAFSPLSPPPSSLPPFDVLAHGLLVPPGNAEALAAALERLIVDAPLRQALGQAGRRFAASRYRLERLVADIERLYGELLRQSHKS